MSNFNPLAELPILIRNNFNSAEFGIFCQTHEGIISTKFSDFAGEHIVYALQVKKFVLALKRGKKLGTFINLLHTKKTYPDVTSFKQQWDEYFEMNTEGHDIFKPKAFDVFMLKDNNQDFPFIGRNNFKENILQAINNYQQGSLRLLVNGVQGVGVSYLRQYLTQLEKNHNCLKQFVIIDCDIDLLKEPHEETHPAHLADSMIYKMGMSELLFIDVDDPAKFKAKYYSRFFETVRKKCESMEEQGIVFFIDHLHYTMNPGVFSFINDFLERLKQFTIPYMVILGGLTTEQIDKSLVIEITLDKFKKEEITAFLGRLYEQLSIQHLELFKELSEQEFTEEALDALGYIENPKIGNVKEVQEEVKMWYKGLLDQILKQSA